ncbi:MAG: gluconeogenesis factor YvcK family protein [Patescibacteria group bacterium]
MRLADKRLKIVTIGAGTGQRALLTALKPISKELASLTAIVAVTDNGGHSGQLRKKYNIPQVGDGRQCLTALATDAKRALIYDTRDKTGRNKGNLILIDYLRRYNSLGNAFKAAAKELSCCGTIVPATNDNVDIVATLADSSLVIGEWEIIKRKNTLPIKLMSLRPPAEATTEAIRAIKKADSIIIAPGSFLTGIISALLPVGIKEAIQQSSANIIQIINFTNVPNLTDGWDALTYVNEIIKYTGRQPEVVIVNKGTIPDWVTDHYHQRGHSFIPSVPQKIKAAKVEVIEADLVPDRLPQTAERSGDKEKATHLLTHDPQRLLQTILSIFN